MSDGLYDLEEIIAEIKSEDGHPPKPASKNQDGEQTAPHPESAAQAEDTPARGKRESLPKGKPMHNTSANSSAKLRLKSRFICFTPSLCSGKFVP
jgi:hypothetical protein